MAVRTTKKANTTWRYNTVIDGKSIRLNSTDLSHNFPTTQRGTFSFNPHPLGSSFASTFVSSQWFLPVHTFNTNTSGSKRHWTILPIWELQRQNIPVGAVFYSYEYVVTTVISPGYKPLGFNMEMYHLNDYSAVYAPSLSYTSNRVVLAGTETSIIYSSASTDTYDGFSSTGKHKIYFERPFVWNGIHTPVIYMYQHGIDPGPLAYNQPGASGSMLITTGYRSPTDTNLPNVAGSNYTYYYTESTLGDQESISATGSSTLIAFNLEWYIP
jgi:hypothetical protein